MVREYGYEQTLDGQWVPIEERIGSFGLGKPLIEAGDNGDNTDNADNTDNL